MSASVDEFRLRRDQLAARIAGQRRELAQAYFQLEKPLRYADYGIRGLGFLRSNPWIFAAVPAVYSVATSLFGGKKKNASASLPGREPSRMDRIRRPVQAWTGRAWQLYQFYRRVRSFFP